MAKQFTVAFLALALLVHLSTAKPIPNSGTEPQAPTLDARCLNGAVEKRCGDSCEFDDCCGFDKCNSCGPCSFVHGFGTCGGFDKCEPCGPCSFVHGFGTCGGFDKCDRCGPCSFVHGFGACGFPCEEFGNCKGFGSCDGCNSFEACGRGACPCGCDTCCLKKRNLPKQKRGGIPYGSGFGYPYGSGYDFGSPYGYGAYGNGACGACGPSVVSSNTVCDNTNQCCNNVAFKNCEHAAASVCKDSDTAYCANKNACSDDNVAKSFVNIA